MRLLIQSGKEEGKGPPARANFYHKPYNIGLREHFSGRGMSKTTARQAFK